MAIYKQKIELEAFFKNKNECKNCRFFYSNDCTDTDIFE